MYTVRSMSSKYYRHTQKEVSKEIQESFLHAKMGAGVPQPVAETLDAESIARRTAIEDTNQVLFAGLLPHGAYGESGPVGAHFFKVLYQYALRKFPNDPQSAFETVILLGTSHEGDSPAIALSKRAWRTPYGVLFPDREIISKLEAEGLSENELAHEQEHSIENQLPFFSSLFPAIKIVPIMVGYGGSQSAENVERLAKILASVIQSLDRQNKILIVCTSDYSHVGPLYNVHPPAPQTTAEFCFQQDRLVLDPIHRLAAKELLQVVIEKQVTMCGVWASICFINLLSILGLSPPKLLQYAPSYVFTDRADITSYASLLSSRPDLVPDLLQDDEQFTAVIKRATLDFRPDRVKPEPPIRPSEIVLDYVVPPPSESADSSSSSSAPESS